MFVLFEQTEPTQILSIARPDQTEEWESYLHCQSTIAAQANTDLPYFAPLNQIAYKLLNLVTWVQRILLLAHAAAHRAVACAVCARLRTRTEKSSRLRTLRAAC